ncbi:MAG: 6-hydroxymethylpterin diphosphokinase MptE-like protein [bacterium]
MSALKKQIQRFVSQLGFCPQRLPVSKKINFISYVIGTIRYQRACHQWQRIDCPKLAGFRDIHSDRARCFIIGNGPSLNRLDLSLLEGEITFAANAIYLLYDRIKWRPTYYAVSDPLVMEDRHKDINALKDSIKFFTLERANFAKRDNNTLFLRVRAPQNYPEFTKDISEVIYGNHTVSFVHMQLAYYMGFRKIYLIGFDHDYKIPEKPIIEPNKYGTDRILSDSEDSNHFDPTYFGKGYRWHVPQIKLIEMAYRKAKEEYEKDGRSIYNATPGTKLDVFDKVDYASLFDTEVK